MSEIRVDLITEKTADGGVTIKSTGTGDNKPTLLTLQTSEADIAANDVLGKIQFQAPDEGTGTDAILVSAAIQARSEGDFAADANATAIDFMVGASEAAATKMSLSSAGKLDVSGGIDIEGGAVFNEDSADVDFRVESNGDVNMLFVDGGNNAVGIATNSPVLANGRGMVVHGGSSVARVELRNDTSGAAATDGMFLTYSGIDAFVGNREAGTIQFWNNGSERLRLHSGGVLSAAYGVALGVGTANTASNVLDDYEEGTYAPTVTCSNSGSYGLSSGGDLLQYTKIGRKVTIQGMISVTSESSPNGALMLSLPFTAPALTDDSDYALYAMGISNNGSTIAGQKFLFLQPGSHAYLFAIGDDGATNYIGEDEVDTNFQFHVNLSYVVS